METHLLEDTIFGVVDCETTGLDPEKDRIVELAIVGCSIVDGIGIGWSNLFDPGIPIPAAASAVHHIVDEDVRGHGRFDQFLKLENGNLNGPHFEVYAAHSAEFDESFLKFGKPMVCTMRLAQKLWPDLESYSNQFLRYHLNLHPPVERGAAMHRALPDALVTASLLVRELHEVLKISQSDDIPPTVESLIKWINKPMLLVTVRFGKHKGAKWSDVPKDYLGWILRSMTDADRDVVYTAKHYLKV